MSRGDTESGERTGVIARFEKLKNNIGGTEEQGEARGTEDDHHPLFLWLFSVPLYPSAFCSFGLSGSV
jgi:hypothetical protein